MNRINKVLAVAAAIAIPCGIALALVGITPKGLWPNSWPKELEPLRDRAKTLYVGWGSQETVYQIPFDSREEFDAAWPHLLSLKSKGAPIILQPGPTQYHFKTGALIKAGVFILWPSGGSTVLPDGTPLRAESPWPESIKSASGELPEYVIVEDGKWVPLGKQSRSQYGFKYRARVDIVLVIDGKVVDTNRIVFPTNTPVVPGWFQK